MSNMINFRAIFYLRGTAVTHLAWIRSELRMCEFINSPVLFPSHIKFFSLTIKVKENFTRPPHFTLSHATLHPLLMC